MLELIRQKRGSKWDNDENMESEDSYDGDAEMGEDEMSDVDEEGELELDEEEGEQDMSESEEEQIPVAVAKQERKTSEVSDIDVDDYGTSSEEYDSDELNVNTTANPHGFVYSNMLDTFKKNRTERIAELKDSYDKEEHRA